MKIKAPVDWKWTRVLVALAELYEIWYAEEFDGDNTIVDGLEKLMGAYDALESGDTI